MSDIGDRGEVVQRIENEGFIDDAGESPVLLDADEQSRLLDESDGLLLRRNEGRRNATSYEDALFACGFGKFHFLILLLCGWAVSSDAVEVLSISFILPSATCDLKLTSSDKGWLNSIVFVGMLFGGYIWGALADRKGRRSILVWSLLLNGVGNLASSVSQVFWLFLICRFFSGVGVGGSIPVVFTYYTEFQHRSKRGAMISLLATFWMAGNIVAAGLAWIVIPHTDISFDSSDFTYHSWRVYIALCTVPSLTSSALFVLMPESPKFLLQKGKEHEAVNVIQQIHRSNKSQRPLNLESLVLSNDDLQQIGGDEEFHIYRQSGMSRCRQLKFTVKKLLDSTAQLFHKPLLHITVHLLIINFTLSFAYYGLFLWFPELFNRLEKYGGSFCDVKTGNDSDHGSTNCEPPNPNVFVDGFLTSLSNLPGNIITIFLVDRIGRKILLTSSMVLSAVSVFFLWFVSTRWENVLISCLFGAISVCGFNMLDVLQTELFPTEVRSTAFGVQTASTRIGAILGNIIFGFLVDVHCSIPMLLVAGLLVFGGVSSLWLPNTTGIDIH